VLDNVARDISSKALPRVDPSVAALSSAIAAGCRAAPPKGPTIRMARVEALVLIRGWTDAALLLAELQAPEWQLRRLERDDGEWSCCLSRHSAPPIEFDEVAEGRHELLPLAILAAVTEAKMLHAPDSAPPNRPPNRQPTGQILCCENFR
jgi:hypothetical protein